MGCGAQNGDKAGEGSGVQQETTCQNFILLSQHALELFLSLIRRCNIHYTRFQQPRTDQSKQAKNEKLKKTSNHMQPQARLFLVAL